MSGRPRKPRLVLRTVGRPKQFGSLVPPTRSRTALHAGTIPPVPVPCPGRLTHTRFRPKMGRRAGLTLLKALVGSARLPLRGRPGGGGGASRRKFTQTASTPHSVVEDDEVRGPPRARARPFSGPPETSETRGPWAAPANALTGRLADRRSNCIVLDLFFACPNRSGFELLDEIVPRRSRYAFPPVNRLHGRSLSCGPRRTGCAAVALDHHQGRPLARARPARRGGRLLLPCTRSRVRTCRRPPRMPCATRAPNREAAFEGKRRPGPFEDETVAATSPFALVRAPVLSSRRRPQGRTSRATGPRGRSSTCALGPGPPSTSSLMDVIMPDMDGARADGAPGQIRGQPVARRGRGHQSRLRPKANVRRPPRTSCLAARHRQTNYIAKPPLSPSTAFAVASARRVLGAR